MQSNEEAHSNQYTKSINNNLLPVNHIPSEHEGQLSEDNSNLLKTIQSRGHTMYVTVKRASHKPNLPSTAATHTQRTNYNPSPSEPFSQPEPNNDSPSPATTISHCSNQNSRYRPTILQYIPFKTDTGRIIIYLHHD